jgi:branched-chain amino acid transport system substrate-binding protein
MRPARYLRPVLPAFAAWSLAAAALAFGPLAPAGAAETVLVGAVNSLTGRFAAQGAAVHNGLVLAIEEANAAPRVPGLSIELAARDDEGKPDRAVAAAEDLLGRRGAAALVGGYVDTMVGPLSEVAERHRRPYLATASLDERLSRRGYRYFFRVSNLAGYVDVMTDFVVDHLKAHRVAVLSSNTPGAAQLGRRQRERFGRAGVAVPFFETFGAGTADFAPHLARVREAGAEVLVANAFFADHLVLVRQLRGLAVDLKGYLGAFGMEFPEVVRDLREAGELLFGTTGWQPGVTRPGTEEASRAFVAAYRARFGGQPPPLAMHGYAAGQALVAALRSARARGLAPGPEAVRDELLRVDLQLPLERLRFDAQGDPRDYERVVLQIQQGNPVVVYPPGRATGRAVYPMPSWRERR